METTYIAGIDIGGTNSVTGLLDDAGRIVAVKITGTPDYPDAAQFIAALAQELRSFPQLQNNIHALKGIGIGAPNGNFYKGTIEHAPNLKWKGVIPVTEMMGTHFPGIDLVLTNDANAAAIGEMMYGKACNEKDFIMITLGTGVGSGIVVNGQLVYGHDGFAGEIGHTIYDPNGRLCGCGRRGCLETYCSAGGIVKTALELLAEPSCTSALKEILSSELSARHIGEAAGRGDATALEVFNITARILALKLADSVAHTSPSSIYIFGGVANAGALLLEPLRRYFEAFLLPIYKNKITIQCSGLDANNAAIMGAAALVCLKQEAKDIHP